MEFFNYKEVMKIFCMMTIVVDDDDDGDKDAGR